MTAEALNQRLSFLERRMTRAEVVLGLGPLEPARPEPAASAASAAQPIPVISAMTAPPVPPPLPPVALEPRPVLNYQPPATRATLPKGDHALERAIGLTWAGRLGAVVLVIGAAMGIKYGYDHGWFAGIPDSVKLSLWAIVGLGLIAAGEWVLRRVNPLSAAGLFAAGVAVLFIVSYAGFGYYELYGRDTAFVMMGACTLIGAVIARRGKLVSIAVLSLLGGNLAPVILHSASPDLMVLCGYLFMLQLVALILAAWGGEAKWWTLRGLSLATQSLWMLTIALDPRFRAQQSLQVWAFAFFAALYHAEMLWSASRAKSASLEPAASGVAFSVAVTAIFTGLVLLELRDASDLLRGLAVIVTALFCAAIGVGLWATRRQTLRTLGAGYLVQAGALLVLAIPVLFNGATVEIGWLILSLAFAVAGRWLDVPVARGGAVAVWALAAGHLGWRWQSDSAQGIHPLLTTLVGVPIPRALLMAAIIVVTGHLLSLLVDRPGQRALSIGAACVWAIASMAMLPSRPATISILLDAACLLAADRAGESLRLAEVAMGQLGLAVIRWLWIHLLLNRFGPGWSATAHPVLFNPIFFTGLFTAALLVSACMLRRGRFYSIEGGKPTDPRTAMLVICSLAVLIAVIGGGFEIDRAFERMATASRVAATQAYFGKQMCLSIYIALFAISAIATGFSVRAAIVRYIGLSLFGLTLMKVVFVDLADIGPGYRVLSFIGLGLTLLATSVLYGKLSPRLLRAS